MKKMQTPLYWDPNPKLTLTLNALHTWLSYAHVQNANLYKIEHFPLIIAFSVSLLLTYIIWL